MTWVPATHPYNGDRGYLSGFTGELVWLSDRQVKPRDVPLWVRTEDLEHRDAVDAAELAKARVRQGGLFGGAA